MKSMQDIVDSTDIVSESKGYDEVIKLLKEAKEQDKKEKVLLTIAILNWINVILMLIFIFVRFCNR